MPVSRNSSSLGDKVPRWYEGICTVQFLDVDPYYLAYCTPRRASKTTGCTCLRRLLNDEELDRKFIYNMMVGDQVLTHDCYIGSKGSAAPARAIVVSLPSNLSLVSSIL